MLHNQLKAMRILKVNSANGVAGIYAGSNNNFRNYSAIRKRLQNTVAVQIAPVWLQIKAKNVSLYV